jgi:molecular chaperone DnaK
MLLLEKINEAWKVASEEMYAKHNKKLKEQILEQSNKANQRHHAESDDNVEDVDFEEVK